MMNEPNAPLDRPDPEFVDALEWQLRREMRRPSLLGDVSRRGSISGIRQALIAIALVVTSIALGATGAYTIVRADDGSQRELRVRIAEIRLEHARLRLERDAAALDETQRLVDRGIVTESETDALEMRLLRAEADMERRRLDVIEAGVTGRTPDDDIAAPLVGRRDYVIERMRAGLDPARHDVEIWARAVTRIEKLAERGAASRRELLTGASRFQAAEAALARLRQRIGLRRQFADGQVDAVTVGLSDLRNEMTAGIERATRALELVAMRYEQLQSLHAVGAVAAPAVREALGEVHEAELELELARTQLELIERRLDEGTGTSRGR